MVISEEKIRKMRSKVDNSKEYAATITHLVEQIELGLNTQNFPNVHALTKELSGEISDLESANAWIKRHSK